MRSLSKKSSRVRTALGGPSGILATRSAALIDAGGAADADDKPASSRGSTTEGSDGPNVASRFSLLGSLLLFFDFHFFFLERGVHTVQCTTLR